jgi:hypothetical protein
MLLHDLVTPTPLMTFIKQKIKKAQFLQPIISTPVIEELMDYLTDRFTGKGQNPADKPVVVTCFDTSGSGKTTTIMEAAKKTNTSVIIISPNLSPVLEQVLRSCHNWKQFDVHKGFINRNEIEEVFINKFHVALETMFGLMESIVKNHPRERFITTLDQGDYHSPNSSTENLSRLSRNCVSSFRKLRNTLDDRRLVIHVDDCQLYFTGIIPNLQHLSDSIPKGEIMALALRCFSKCVTPFAGFKNIVWVFSGTRPTLLTEITLTSGLHTVDISDMMQDFSCSDVETILNSYFDLASSTVTDMVHVRSLCIRLSGPPKNIYFFLSASSRYIIGAYN